MAQAQQAATRDVNLLTVMLATPQLERGGGRWLVVGAIQQALIQKVVYDILSR